MRPGGFSYLEDLRRILRQSRRYITFIAFTFLLGAISGFFLYKFFPDEITLLVSDITARLAELTRAVEAASLPGAICMIFWKNFKVVLTCVASGLLFGILPVFAVFSNGFFIGVAASHASSKGLNVPLLLLGSVAPHGIFEVPAVILGGVIGMRIGFNILALFRSRQTIAGVLRVLADAVMIMVLVIAPLLAVAASIEMTVTRHIVTHVIAPGLGTF